MHENIKYTVKLSEATVPFVSFDDMKSGATDPVAKSRIGDWQCIYNDHRYGTLHMVYTKFIGSQKGDAFHVDKIQLYIQNYTGAVSIGFHSSKYTTIIEEPVGPFDHDYDPRYPDRKRVKLRFALQGMVNNKDRWINTDVAHNQLVIKENDVLETYAVFVPVDNAISKIFESDEEKKTSAYVDPEFMDRLGEDVFVRPENISRIYDLYHEDPRLVDKEDLKRGFGFYPEENKRIDFKIVMIGRPYPCIPIFSIFKF